MQLHDLVALRNNLEQSLKLDVIYSELHKNHKQLVDLSAVDLFHDDILALANNHQQCEHHLTANKAELAALVGKINQEITNRTGHFFSENYQTELRYSTAHTIREVRQLHLADVASNELQNRINMYSNWKYPALEIGCRDGEYTKYLVASDPLYISDVYDEFLDNAANQFNPQYQARLRKYKIIDNQLLNLPKNQFGFVFSFNFFNYLSLDSIKMYLKQVMDLLRPGGIMLFTYNNADIPTAAGLAESYYMTYVPKSMLIPLIESMGFKVLETKDFVPSTSWIEIKKPGRLETIKAHQALGEIKYF